MPIITFEQRKAKIHCVEDIEIQLRLAKEYVCRLRRKAKNFDGLLKEKLAIHDDMKSAEIELRKLRLNVFDIEDELNAQSERE